MKRFPVPLTRPTRGEAMAALIQRAQGCVACPRMDGRRRVLSRLNGDPYSPVIFIAESPGRYGAERTGIPIHGDATGANFERLLASIHYRREDVFITNAVLCNPQKPNGTNDTPSELEARNCSVHLRDTITIVDPAAVVTLGQRALASLSLVQPHTLTLRGSVATPQPWAGRVVFPLYHPSPRVMGVRNMQQQLADFKAMALYLLTHTERG